MATHTQLFADRGPATNEKPARVHPVSAARTAGMFVHWSLIEHSGEAPDTCGAREKQGGSASAMAVAGMRSAAACSGRPDSRASVSRDPSSAATDSHTCAASEAGQIVVTQGVQSDARGMVRVTRRRPFA